MEGEKEDKHEKEMEDSRPGESFSFQFRGLETRDDAASGEEKYKFPLGR